MSFVVDPVWSWPVTLAVAAGLVAFVLWTYPPRIRHLPRRTRGILLGSRLAAVALLVLAALRPAVERREDDERSFVLFVAADASRSMSTPDGAGGTTRRQSLLRTLEGNAGPFEKLGKDFELRRFDFAERSDPVEKFADRTDGTQTALGALLEGLLRETQSQRVAGILLLTDGAQRALPPNDADPRAVARRLGEVQVPIVPVPFGGEGITGTAVDVGVEDLLVDPLVFEKKIVPVTVKLRTQGAAGRDLTVRLLLEDRTGKRPGESGELKPVTGTALAKPIARVRTERNADLLPVELTFVPEHPGEYKLAVEVESPEGELLKRNNRVETIVTVKKGGVNIAYFDRVRPEQKFLRVVNASQNIQLVFRPMRSDRPGTAPRIDGTFFEPGRFDAYVIGDVPADAFGPALLGELAARVREGAGLLMFGGLRTFEAGGYGGTPVADLLPVDVQAGAAAGGDGAALARADATQLQQDLRIVPTPRGLSHFVMRLDAPDKNRARWEALPPLQGANRLRLKPQSLAEVLAETSERIPLLVAHEVGASRVAAFAGDTTYLWVLAGERESHQRFWRQMLLWLSRKELDSDQPVWVRVQPRNFAPGQRVEVEFGAHDDKHRPVEAAEFRLEVVDPAGRPHVVPTRRTAGEGSADVEQTQVPGDYWVKATGTVGGRVLGPPAWTRFVVDARDLELDRPAADVGLLQELAVLSGGSVVPPEQLSAYLGRLAEDGPQREGETSLHRTNLWDHWLVVVAFVSLMSVEWIVRKRRGLV